jgi:hypothetical protein
MRIGLRRGGSKSSELVLSECIEAASKDISTVNFIAGAILRYLGFGLVGSFVLACILFRFWTKIEIHSKLGKVNDYRNVKRDV